MEKDRIYAETLNQVNDFSFNKAVVDVFPDMISRSVPGYSSMIAGIGQLTAEFYQSNGRIYDLGCSLCAASLSIAKHCQSAEIIALDNSAEMVSRAKSHIANYAFAKNIRVIESDITQFELQAASVIVMNFTLQFIPPEKREALINKCYEALLPGGVLILSEKIRCIDERANRALINLHHDFKRQNGYSDLEISQKRSALEKVMILDTFDAHRERLLSIGFNSVNQWYQCYNFASFFAIK